MAVDELKVAEESKLSENNVAEESKLSENNNGSTEVQITIITSRINRLTDHLRDHKHDQSSKRGLLTLVGKRRKLLRYLNNNDTSKYESLTDKLSIRR